MTIGCLSDQKETTQKYCKIARIDQARMVLYSVVEWHNGALSLKHHTSRHLSAEKLSSRVVLHNYFSKRKNGTTTGRTAAERFFHEKPKDIFTWLLERV